MCRLSTSVVGALVFGFLLGGRAADAQPNPPPFGVIDTPAPGQPGVSGSLAVTGWALDDSGVINHVDFLVDGKIVAGAVVGQASTAFYGTPRPDVFAAFPSIPNSLNSGFVANIDTTALVDGVHVFSVRVFDSLGASSVIDSRTAQVINNGALLPSFGFLDYPLDKASILCNPATPEPPPNPNPGGCPSPPVPPCIPGIPGQNPEPLSFYKNVVTGWALDVGAFEDRGQVSYVELLIDGNVIANTRRDCILTTVTTDPPVTPGLERNALVNCYGVNRPDVAHAYPGYVNADNSGFFFAFALQPHSLSGLFDILMPDASGSPRLVGFTASGKHTLSIRAGDEKETVTQIAVISVDVLCDIGSFGDRPAFGYIDTPTNMQFIKGITTFSGWAFDYDNGGQSPEVNGVTRIDIDIDGVVVACLSSEPFCLQSFNRSRPDVPAGDFRVPATATIFGPTAFVGWAFTFDTGRLPDGQHDLVVYAWDTPVTGRPRFRSEIGRRKFVVFNNTSTKG
jgi:Bacterial Ig domain